MARVLVVENLEPGHSPWWLPYLPAQPDLTFEIECVPEASMRSALPTLLRVYRKSLHYDVIITNQDGYATFLFAALRTLTDRSRPLHLVMEFITKQKNSTLYSRFKYWAMSIMLRSVTRFICSAKRETELYPRELKLPKERFVDVPLMTNPKFLDWESKYPTDFSDDGYILASGYTGRDFKTFLEAVATIEVPVRLITAPKAVEGLSVPPHVELLFSLPFAEYIEHVARARIVVVPLLDWDISVGQSVILEALALARPLVATRAPGSIDYVQHEQNGLLVTPGSSDELRAALLRLLADRSFAKQLTIAGRAGVRSHSTPQAVLGRVAELIRGLLKPNG